MGRCGCKPGQECDAFKMLQAEVAKLRMACLEAADSLSYWVAEDECDSVGDLCGRLRALAAREVGR